MISKLKCLLNFHNWVNIDPFTPVPKAGERILFSNLHKCENCKTEKWLGMGWII